MYLKMASVFDLIVSCANELIKSNQVPVYFFIDKDLDRVDCICNFCSCNIFLGITIENFNTFNNILQFHLSNEIHFDKFVKFNKDCYYSRLKSFNCYGRKSFRRKLSSCFTQEHFNKIQNKLSVTIINEFIIHLRCEFCCKEFLMHRECNLLTTFVEHFAVNHENLLILKDKEPLNLHLGNHGIRDLSFEKVKKSVGAQQKGFLKSVLSYSKANMILKLYKNQNQVILFNHVRYSNSKLYDRNSLSPKNLPFSKSYFKNSKTKKRNLSALSLVPERKSETIFDFISNIPVHLTNDQIYIIVNNRQTIDCMCNLCCCSVFKHITIKNFCSFKEKLKIHLYDEKHSHRLKLFDGEGYLYPESFRLEFLVRITKYFTKNNRRVIKSNLELEKLRNNFVLLYCKLCTKAFVMHMNCKLKTSFVTHLKDSIHENKMKDICDRMSKPKEKNKLKPKQTYHYHSLLGEEKFIEIMSKLEKSAKIPKERNFYCLSVVTNLTGDKKLFCFLCQRTLPYNCEQPVQRLVKFVEYHINNSVNHFIPIFLQKSNLKSEIKKKKPLIPYTKPEIDKTMQCRTSNSETEGKRVKSDLFEKFVVEEDIKRIFDNKSKQKQEECSSQLDLKKFNVITRKLEKRKNIQKGRTVCCLSLKSDVTGDQKLYCVLCQNILPYNCEQPVKEIVKLVECHINYSENHFISNLNQNIDETKKICSKNSEIGLKGKISESRLCLENILGIKTKSGKSKSCYLNCSGIGQNKENGGSAGTQNLQMIEYLESFPSVLFMSSSLSSPSGEKENKKKIRNHEKGKVHKTKKYYLNDSETEMNRMPKLKKWELKLQQQKSFSTYSEWIFNPKAQRVYDFNKSRKLMAKRRLKEKEIRKYFQGLKVHKKDFLSNKKSRCVELSGEKIEIRHHQRNPVSLLYLTEFRLQTNNFSALMNLNVLSMTEEEENYCYQQVHKISTKKRPTENRVPLNTLEKYINDYVCISCFNILIDDYTFFTIISYVEKYLFCMFCRHDLPFNCNLPLEELCYLLISHLDSCLSNLL